MIPPKGQNHDTPSSHQWVWNKKVQVYCSSGREKNTNLILNLLFNKTALYSLIYSIYIVYTCSGMPI